jgi:hypothetical protein
MPEHARWPAWAVVGSLCAGLAAGVAAGHLLPGGRRAALGAAVLAYAHARAHGRSGDLAPTLLAWLRAAAPVWLGGLWSPGGAPIVLAALGLHGFALGLGLGVAGSTGGARGVLASALTLLPGNILALPALGWLGAHALRAALRPGREPLPSAGYLRLGAAVLAGVAAVSLVEALITPLVLQLAGVLGLSL